MTRSFWAVYPEHDIRAPQKDVKGFISLLMKSLPEEGAGIAALFDDTQGMAKDVARLSAAKGQVEMSRFADEYPVLARHHRSTWGDMMSARVRDPRLKGVLSGQWGYYGLPPSKLWCFYPSGLECFAEIMRHW
jgi:prolycopene isomerase